MISYFDCLHKELILSFYLSIKVVVDISSLQLKLLFSWPNKHIELAQFYICPLFLTNIYL